MYQALNPNIHGDDTKTVDETDWNGSMDESLAIFISTPQYQEGGIDYISRKMHHRQ